MSGIAKCFECVWNKPTPTKKEAEQLATLHMRFVGHIMVFGYKKGEEPR